jgi:hypothetical protein
MPGRLGIAFNVIAQVLLSIALFLGINYLSYEHFKRWDLSANEDFTLSSSTTNSLRKLGKDVEITVIFTRGSKLYEQLQGLTGEYRRNGKNRVKVDFVDPTRDHERAEELKLQNKFSITQSGILVKANKRSRFIPEQELIIASPGADKDHPHIDFRGEDALTSTIESLIAGEPRKFYFITGKGARAEADTAAVLGALVDLGLQQNFDVATLNLAEVTAVPGDANGLLFVGPKYDLSAREVGILTDYWGQKRASALFLLDPTAETPLLDGFLGSVGVVPRGDRVLRAESTSAGPRKEFTVQASFNDKSAVTSAIKDATTAFAGQTQSLALRLTDEKLREQGVLVVPLSVAASDFWGEESYLDDLPLAGGPKDTPPPVFLAAAVERGAVADERLRVDSARLVVVGNATLLDKETRQEVNQDFLASSLNWMLRRERLMGITPKRKIQYLLRLTQQQRELLFWITAFCAPGLVLGVGLSVWAARRAS